VRPGQVVVSSLSFIECCPPVVRRVLSPIVRQVSSPIIRRRSTRGPPHEQLLVRLGRVVHRCLSSIIVVPSRLSFPHCLLFVVPSVIHRRHHRTALVHPQSTRQVVAHQHGGGCSVIRRHHPCRHHSSSLFPLSSFIIIRHHHPCSLSSLFIAVPVRRRPCSLLSLFVVVIPVVVVPVIVVPVVVIICCHHLLLLFVHPSPSFLVHRCSLSSVVHPLVPPAVHPTSSCS
jgi:hypothetical protein